MAFIIHFSVASAEVATGDQCAPSYVGDIAKACGVGCSAKLTLVLGSLGQLYALNLSP